MLFSFVRKGWKNREKPIGFTSARLRRDKPSHAPGNTGAGKTKRARISRPRRRLMLTKRFPNNWLRQLKK
jgi:hypothetical protein